MQICKLNSSLQVCDVEQTYLPIDKRAPISRIPNKRLSCGQIGSVRKTALPLGRYIIMQIDFDTPNKITLEITYAYARAGCVDRSIHNQDPVQRREGNNEVCSYTALSLFTRKRPG